MKNKKTSVLESVIQQAWQESDLTKAKKIVVEHIENSSIKSKETVLQNIKTINSKERLDYYLANSLLYFEGHTINF